MHVWWSRSNNQITKLLVAAGADVNALDNDGASAVHQAVMR